jgi:TonB family protein
LPRSRHLSPLQWAFILSLSIHSLLLWQIWPVQPSYLAAGNNMQITLLRRARINHAQQTLKSADNTPQQNRTRQNVVTRQGDGPLAQDNSHTQNAGQAAEKKQRNTHAGKITQQPDEQNEQQQSADNLPADTPQPVHLPASDNLPNYAQQVLQHIIAKASAAPHEGNVTVQIKLMRIGFAMNVQIASSSGDTQLDRWVIQQILAANPFPPFAPDDNDNEKTLLIPIHFQWAH